ncbi:MAG: CatA-like O-acetyltransferase [Bacilli bacterium]|jgi:chloramphenicol O-acetyltransferase type A
MNNYKIIKVEDHAGRKHFNLFNQYSDPTYGITAQVNITNFYRYVKSHQLPVYLSLIFLVTKALNQITEFRYRFDGENIRLYERIDPAFTIMTDIGLYDNCDIVDIRGDFPTFLADAKDAIAIIKTGSDLAKPQADERLDQFYYTSTPWIEFLAITHPMNNGLFAYIPRVTWDKFHIESDCITMHLNIIVHHALVDGKPLADGFLKIQEYLSNPEQVFKQ